MSWPLLAAFGKLLLEKRGAQERNSWREAETKGNTGEVFGTESQQLEDLKR